MACRDLGAERRADRRADRRVGRQEETVDSRLADRRADRRVSRHEVVRARQDLWNRLDEYLSSVYGRGET